MSTAQFQATADILDGWRDDVLSGTPPTLYPVGTGELGRIEIGPGLVTLHWRGTGGRQDRPCHADGWSTP